MGIIRRNRVERYVALSQKQYLEQKRRRTSKVKTKCCCCCQEGEQEEMFSKFASLLTFAFVVLLALSSTTALAQGDGSADQVFAGKSPDFEKKYCKEHAGDKACHDWCKQHPKQDGSSSRPGELPISDLKPLLKDLGVDLNKEDFKHVKQKLNNGGYFNLVSFFFFWSEFVICEAISG